MLAFARILKNVITQVLAKYNLEPDQVILFGSRAKGNFNKDSDWDVLVIIRSEISRDTEMKLLSEIRKKLAKVLIPCDILIRTKAEVKKFKGYVHSVTKTALKEGIIL